MNRDITVHGNVSHSIFISGDGNLVPVTSDPPSPPALRGLVVIADPLTDRRGTAPPSVPPLNVWREWRDLQSVFPADAPWEIIRLAPVTKQAWDDALSRAANQSQPFRLVHFVGHGNGQGLVIEDSLSREYFLSAAALTELLEGQAVELIFLNACHTVPLAESLVAEGVVRAAVATEDKVLDTVAIAFAQRFYERLALGDTVGRAFRKAQRRVAPQVSPYRLWGDETLALRGAERGSLRVRRYPLPTYGIPWQMAERFVGRREHLMTLGRWMQDGDEMTFALYGVGGIGKTALAVTAALRFAPAGRFRAVIFASTEGRDSYAPSELLTALRSALSLPAEPIRDEAEAAALVAQVLGKGSYLLILDNLESLSPASAATLARMLRQVDARNGSRVLFTLRPREKDPLTELLPGRNLLHVERMSRADAMALLWHTLWRELKEPVAARRLAEVSVPPDERIVALARQVHIPDLVARLYAPALYEIAAQAFDYPAILKLVASMLRDMRWAEVATRLQNLPRQSDPATVLQALIGQMIESLRERTPQAAQLLCAMLPFRGGAPEWALWAVFQDLAPTVEGFVLQEGQLFPQAEAFPIPTQFRDTVIQPALDGGLLQREEVGPLTRYRLEPFVRHYLTQAHCAPAQQRAYGLRHASRVA